MKKMVLAVVIAMLIISGGFVTTDFACDEKTSVTEDSSRVVRCCDVANETVYGAISEDFGSVTVSKGSGAKDDTVNGGQDFVGEETNLTAIDEDFAETSCDSCDPSTDPAQKSKAPIGGGSNKPKDDRCTIASGPRSKPHRSSAR